MPLKPTPVQEAERARGLRALVSSFARGIVDTVAADQIPDDAVADALNVEFDRTRNLRTRQGCSRLNWNGNLIGDNFEDFEAGWVLFGLDADNAAFTTPAGTPASASGLNVDGSEDVGYASLLLAATAQDEELWGASAYFRVPVDPFNPPASWDDLIPAIDVEFSGGTALRAGIALVPDIAAENAWAIRPIDVSPAPWFVTDNAPVDYAIGEVVEDEVDDEYQWIQVGFHVVNNDSSNTDVTIRVTPGIGIYTYDVPSSTVLYSQGENGRVAPQLVITPTVAPGMGIWGVVLERGVSSLRRPNEGGEAATIEDNYLTGRVTSVAYYRTPSQEAIICTSGNKVYRYDDDNNWFEDITGDFNFPDGTLWQWVNYDGVLYGVNRGSSTRASMIFELAAATNFADGNTVTVGSEVYTMETGALDAPFKVKVGADGDESIANLVDAIMGTGTEGVHYAEDTTANEDVYARQISERSFEVTAWRQGSDGNAIVVGESSANGSWEGGATSLAGGAGYDNPIKLATPQGALEVVEGLPPAGRYIANWNSRLWIVPEDEPWTIQASKLGDGENWYDTNAFSGAIQAEVGQQENFDVTGIHVHQGTLVCFKRDRIYAISPGGAVPTDASALRQDLVTRGIGSISGYAIRTLLEDVIFMSAYGLASLSLLEKFGVFRENVISRDVAAFGDPEVKTERAIVEIYPRKSQAMIAFAPRLGGVNSKAFLLDYRGVAQGDPDVPPLGFTRLSGPFQACSACLADVVGEERLLLGGELETTGLAYVWAADEDGSFTDEGTRYPVSIVTKAYSWGDFFRLKRFHRWEGLFELLEEDFEATVTWRPDLQRATFQQWKLPLEAQASGGALYDSTAIYDESLYDAEGIISNVFVGGRFAGSVQFGRYARALQAEISPGNQSSSGFVLKGLALLASWGKDSSSRGMAQALGGGVGSIGQPMVEDSGHEMVWE